MNKNQFQHLLDKYLQGECTPEEAFLLHQFYDSFQQEMQEDDSDEIDVWLTQEKIHSNVNHRINYAERLQYEARCRKSRKTRRLVQFAASMLLVLGLGLGSYIEYTNMPAPEIAWIEKTTAKGQKATITLTDGTKVYLNVDSKLSFPEHFNTDKREVILEGEAFFEVARNPKRPFTIKSGDLTTTVLGTSFNVKAFAGEAQHVTVVTGKVKVNTQSADGTSLSLFLTPHQQAFYDGKLHKKEVDIKPFIAWREKVLHFDEVSLEEAVVVLERWYDVSFDIKNDAIRPCKISGKYIHEDLINVMESFEHILGIQYQIEDDQKIILSGQGCHVTN